MLLKIRITNLQKKHLSEVYDLLKSNVSKFRPNKNQYNLIWKKLSKQKNNYFIVAKNNKDLLGFGSLSIILKVRGNKQGVIEDIVVKKKFRKNKIGRSIVLKLLEIAKKQKCYKVVLQSPKKNLTFYKKIGFITIHKSMQKLLKF